MTADTDSHTAALRALTRFSVGSAVWLGLIGVGGVVYAATLGTSSSEQVQLIGLGVGAGLVLVSLAFLVALVVVWRRDVRAAPLVADDRPECADGGATMFYEGYVSVWSFLIAVTIVVLGIVIVPSAAEGAAWGWITPVVMGTVAVTVGLFVRWRGCEYVGVHADGVRMIRRGRLETASWSKVLYFESGQVGIEGKPDRAGVRDEVGTRIKESAIAAGLATFEDRLRCGESIDLGAVTLQPAVLVVEGVPIRWGEIDSVTYEHDGENNWTHVVVRDRRRRPRAKVKETGIANIPVFKEALRRYTGLQV
ncbi:hypothetical protein [Aeromicrobium sp. UC242_57]|uniref:hypothetical protein n=1 Tax=Aeromicrobium sp. UC242_57 TaxID=3374624 RepID=UPI00378CB726